MRIALVEDEESSLRQALEFIRRFGQETGEKCVVDTFKNGLDFLSDYDPVYDLVLLDIKMPHTVITIPSGVAKIGIDAFELCSSLEKVYFERTAGWLLVKSMSGGQGILVDPSSLAQSYLAKEFLLTQGKEYIFINIYSLEE